MATTVDERIVAAKFDASDFEKGVDKTIKKLDELKKNLDFKEATKGVKELAEKTEVSTNSMSNSLEKLTDRFTNFTGMIKQRILGGLADEVANVFLRMERSVTSFVRAIGSDQVTVGMSKYEQMLTSVRVMMSAGESEGASYGAIEKLRDYSDQTSYSLSQMSDALSKLRSSGVGLDQATKSVEGIANACASAGINATDAQRAFYNLSQAYSSGFLNYTDYRSLEILNMTTEKFRQNILDAAVEAKTLKKVSEGVYKTIKDGNKRVTAGKKVTINNLKDTLKYNFVTNDVMNELFGGKYFFDEEKFKEYKKKYKTIDEAIKAAKKDFGDTAVEAYLAAREARSFTDVINTLKDVVSTGWSTTFEHLFGKLEKAKDFFTKLAEGELADIIYKIGEFRNAVLEVWDDSVTGIENSGGGAAFRDSILNITDALGTLLRTILEIIPGFEEMYYKEGKATPITQSLGDRLYRFTLVVKAFTQNVKDAAERFHDFMHKPIDGKGISRIELIRNILRNLLSILGTFGKVAGIALAGFLDFAVKLEPVFTSLLGFIEKVTSPLIELRNNKKVFGDIEDSFNNVSAVLDKIAEPLGEIIGFLGEIAAFIVSMGLDTLTTNISFIADIIDFIVSIITGNSEKMEKGEDVLSNLRKDFEGIKDACKQGLGAVKDFFGTLLDDLKELFGLTDDEGKDKEKGGVFSRLRNFFETNEFVDSAKKWVDQAIVDIKNFIISIPSRVKELGANIYDTIYNLLFTKEKTKTTDENGNIIEQENEVLTELGVWVDQAIKDIKAFIADIPNKVIKAIGYVGSWIDLIFDTLMGRVKPTETKTDEKDVKKNAEEVAKKAKEDRFQAFLDEITKSIKTWFDDLPQKIRAKLKGTGDFFTRVWNAIDEFLFGKKVTKKLGLVIDPNTGKSDGQKKTMTVRIKKGFSLWLDEVIKEAKKFIANIPTYIKEGIKGVGDIATTIIGAIFGKTDGQEMTSADIENKIAEPFQGVNLTSVINSIKEIGTEILNQIARMFTGSEDVDKNMKWFSEQVAKGIGWIREKAEAALLKVKSFFVTLPTRIAGFITGEGEENSANNTDAIGTEISNFAKTIGDFIAGIPNDLAIFFTNAIEAIGKLWNKLYTSLMGNNNEDTQLEKNLALLSDPEQEYYRMYAEKMKKDTPRKKSKWEQFVENIGKLIATAFQELPTWIAEGIHMAVANVDSLLGEVTKWFEDQNIAKEMAKEAEKARQEVEKGTTGVVSGAEKGAEEASKESGESPLVTAIKGIGQSIYNIITTTIPGFVKEAWKWLGSTASDIWDGIKDIFSGDVDISEKLTGSADSLGSKIVAYLKTELPGKIKVAWDEIKDLAKDIYYGIHNVFTGDIPENERVATITNVVNNIKKFITEDIPNALSGLFEKKDEALEKNLALLSSPEQEYYRAYAEKMKKDSRGLTKNSAGVSSVFEGLKDSIINGFKSIGPAILDGIANALDFLGNIAEIIINHLTGKKPIDRLVDEKFKGKEPELVKSIKNIGESIKKFLLETIPTFIGSAFGTLAADAPKLLEQFFSAFNTARETEQDKLEKEAAKDADDAKDPVEGAKSAVNLLHDFFTMVNASFAGIGIESIATILAIAYLVKALGNLFSLTDEIDATAGALKWTAITIAVSALAGIAASIISIVSENDPSKIQAANGFFDKISDILFKVIWIVGLLQGGKVLSSLLGLFDGEDSKKVADVTKKMTKGEKIANGFIDALSSFFGIIGVSAGAKIGVDIAGSAVDDLFGIITDSFMTMSVGIADALSVISPVVDELKEMNDKVYKATDTCQQLSVLFTQFYWVFEKLYKEIYGDDENNDIDPYSVMDSDMESIVNKTIKQHSFEKDSRKEFMDILQERVELFIELSQFLDNIVDSVSKFSTVRDFDHKIEELGTLFGEEGKFTGFLVKLMDSLSDAMSKSKLDPKKWGVTPDLMAWRNSGISIALEMLGSSISIFSNGISGLTEENVTSFGKTIDILDRIAEVVQGKNFDNGSWGKLISGDKTLSTVGYQIKMFGLHMEKFYEYITNISGFDNADLRTKTNAQVESVVKIAKGMGEAISYLNNNTDVERFEEFGKKLPEAGKNIGGFIVNIRDIFSQYQLDWSPQKLSSMSDLISSIGTLLSGSSPYAYGVDLSSITEEMWRSLNGEQGKQFVKDMQIIIRRIAKIVEPDDVSIESLKESGKTIGNDILLGIKESLENPEDIYTPKITPVLELEDAKQQLIDFFGVGTLDGFNLSEIARQAIGANNQTEEDRVTASYLNSQITDVITAIKAGPDNIATITDVSNAFANMKIVTDTGVLVGVITPAIDSKIGDAIMLIERNVTPTYSV